MPQARPCRTGCPSAPARVACRTLLPILGLLVINPPHDALRAQSQKTQHATPVPERTFEVASVKVNQQTLAEYVRANQNNSSAALNTIGIRTLPGGRLSAGFVTLRALILRAFDIKTYQLEGGPAWANTTNFTIDARADPGFVAEFASPPLRDALQQQLGLKLEATRAPLPIVVIESAEMPTPD